MRAATTSDAGLLTRVLTDLVIRKHLGGPVPLGCLPVQLERMRADGVFVVELLDATPIGIVRIGRDALCEREISYEFLPEHWGRGYAQEACFSLLEWAFGDTVDGERIVAVTQVANAASIALLRRLGMTEVDRFHEWGEAQVKLAIGRPELRSPS